ncbi:hypothetical protein BDW75DRAFT_235607 [Aspergillus navahoensis]
MDLFTYYQSSHVWICKLCQYAVCPQQLKTHLRLHHYTHPTAATDVLRQDAYQKMSKQPWLDPAREPCVFPDPDSPPIPNLPIYTGYRCSQCSYIVEEALEQDIEDEQVQMQQIPLRKHATEVSPWLELTRWPEYLGTCNLVAAAALGALPDPSQEPLLVLLVQSVERLIQQSYHTIKDRRINEFDQIRINTFLSQQPKIWDRPFQIHLKPSTYTSYRQVW